MTVHDILLEHRKWIGSSEFVKLVVKRLKVEDRQAYRRIRDASVSKDEAHRIKKHVFPDRTVWYGLPEFGPPSPVKGEAKERKCDRGLYLHFVKTREKVSKLLSYGAYYFVEEAWDITQRQIQPILPSLEKDLLIARVKERADRIERAQIRKENSYKALRDSVLQTWDEIFAVLQGR